MDILGVVPAEAIIAVDTAPLIYYIEGGSPYDALLVQIFEDCVATGRNLATVSVVALSEVLAGAYQWDRRDLEQQYKNILTGSRNLELVNVTPDVADDAARLRAQYRLRLPDALHLASALISGAEFLITNDAHFRNVTELRILLLSRLV